MPVSLVAQTAPAETPKGDSDLISVPILVDDVPPRTRMSVDEFIEPSTGKVRYLQFAPNQVPSDVVTDLREIIGRRSGKQLYAGEWVLKGELCDAPQWNVPCDIPADWSVIELSSLDVRGLQIAEVGDQIDLIAVRPIESVELQEKAVWPDDHREATFQKPNREDVFRQGDVATLVTQARVVGRAERTIQVPTVEEKMTVGNEKQLGETLERESVQTTRTTSLTPIESTVWQIAVPLKAVVSITEALAIKSIVDNGDRGPVPQGPPATGEPVANEASPQFRDHNVTIYAVLRSPDSTEQYAIPSRDIVSEWMARWGKRFSEFSKSERQQSKSVRTVQHIRGTEMTQDHWLDGRFFDEFPQDAVKSRTVETLIDREQTQEDR